MPIDTARMPLLIAGGGTHSSGRGLAPGFAYGRHRGPARFRPRVAAVAIAFYLDESGHWHFPLTLRPPSVKHHAGQICLPGGGIEIGESPLQAALREFEEELGATPRGVRQLGQLSALYVYASNHVIQPVVFRIEPPRGPWRPAADEVSEVIRYPLRRLLEPEGRVISRQRRSLIRDGRVVGRLDFRAPGFRCEPQPIWGATAIVLEELRVRVGLAPALHIRPMGTSTSN